MAPFMLMLMMMVLAGHFRIADAQQQQQQHGWVMQESTNTIVQLRIAVESVARALLQDVLGVAAEIVMEHFVVPLVECTAEIDDLTFYQLAVGIMACALVINLACCCCKQRKYDERISAADEKAKRAEMKAERAQVASERAQAEVDVIKARLDALANQPTAPAVVIVNMA